MKTISKSRATMRSRMRTLPGLRAAIRAHRTHTSSPPLHGIGSLALGRDQDGWVTKNIDTNSAHHMLIVGASGSGKTSALNFIFHQLALADWSIIALDPHGGHEDGIITPFLKILKSSPTLSSRPVRLFDLDDENWITGFNPLARDGERDPAVVGESTTIALERASEDHDMASKQTIQRMLGALLPACNVLGLTFWEAFQVLDIEGGAPMREWMLHQLDDAHQIRVLSRFHERCKSSRREAEIDAIGVENRLAHLCANPRSRLTFSAPKGLSLKDCMDRKEILLCNLQPGNHAGDKTCRMTGMLLIREILAHAKLRKKKTPVMVIIDEAHLLLTSGKDIDKMLVELRKNSVHLVLATQTLQHLRNAGDDIFYSCMGVRTKLIFGKMGYDDAEYMARETIQVNLNRPIDALTKPVTVAYQREWMHNKSWSQSSNMGWSVSLADMIGGSETTSSSESKNDSSTDMDTASTSATQNCDVSGNPTGSASNTGTNSGNSSTKSASRSVSNASSSQWAQTVTTSKSGGTSKGSATGLSEALVPIIEWLPTAIYSREDQLYMAAWRIKNLPTGAALLSIAGEQPKLVRFPMPQKILVSDTELALYRERLFEADPVTWRVEVAEELFAQREKRLHERIATFYKGKNQERVEREDNFDAWD